MNKKAKIIIGVLGALLTLFIALFIYSMGLRAGSNSTANNPQYNNGNRQNQYNPALPLGRGPTVNNSTTNAVLGAGNSTGNTASQAAEMQQATKNAGAFGKAVMDQ